MSEFNEISTSELQVIQKDNTAIIIDVRSSDAYNGWRLRNEKRGGHIKGAKTLPVKWTKYMDWIEIVISKGIKPDQPVIL
jgi:thiosulfate/3-mercaptopyruvate sulfurtransferase